MNEQHTPGQRVCYGITIRPNQFSAPWRRLWWITDIGGHGAKVRASLIKAAGVKAADVKTWNPNVSFPSLRAACAAIAEAVEGCESGAPRAPGPWKLVGAHLWEKAGRPEYAGPRSAYRGLYDHQAREVLTALASLDYVVSRPRRKAAGRAS